MKNTIYKKSWSKCKPNTFIELGFDKDNNKYIIGVNTEIEKDNGNEIRKKGIVKVKYVGLYIRMWVLKYSISIGTKEIEIVKKNRNNIKLIIGIAGIKK